MRICAAPELTGSDGDGVLDVFDRMGPDIHSVAPLEALETGLDLGVNLGSRPIKGLTHDPADLFNDVSSRAG
ncbi:hypothetical protein [Fulvimarina manganoxydans]|uniref:hypothetical protein n=1 Tax=Fulvimarina manganoxydans TaxID=937218 RepID=UPI001483A703|nr:hypothetical protein [Fulvimarina manganoxydans]